MACCIIITAIDMDGRRIMLILPLILSDRLTGMRRGGITGINNILNMCRLLRKDTPIGAPTIMVSIMTRISITGIIPARAPGGRKASMVRLQAPNPRDGGKSLLQCPRLKDADPVLTRRPILPRRPPLSDGDHTPVR